MRYVVLHLHTGAATMTDTATTLTLAELRTVHALGRLLLAGGRPPMPHWNADTVREFAAQMTGAAYPRNKTGLRRAFYHIEHFLDLALEAA